MFLTAFYGLMRVGEITVRSLQESPHNHCLDSLVFLQHNNKKKAVTILFRSSKHSKGLPFKVRINKIDNSKYCPVFALEEYIRLRGNKRGPLFCYPSNEPILRSAFTNKLNMCLNLIGLSAKSYKGHSFRIGAATAYASKGLSDSQLRIMGRWRSNAFLKYIRIHSV